MCFLMAISLITTLLLLSLTGISSSHSPDPPYVTSRPNPAPVRLPQQLRASAWPSVQSRRGLSFTPVPASQPQRKALPLPLTPITTSLLLMWPCLWNPSNLVSTHVNKLEWARWWPMGKEECVCVVWLKLQLSEFTTEGIKQVLILYSSIVFFLSWNSI